jgi:alkylated DNA repair dioxygenase AlkB
MPFRPSSATIPSPPAPAQMVQPVLGEPWICEVSSPGELWSWPGFLDGMEGLALFEDLWPNTPWQSETIRIQGQDILVPRQIAWHGDARAYYRYSGVNHAPAPWTPTLLALKDRLEKVTQARYNSVLLNLYRDGKDSVAWHGDNERELGLDPTIASLGFVHYVVGK